jgi:hypothetical protein
VAGGNIGDPYHPGGRHRHPRSGWPRGIGLEALRQRGVNVDWLRDWWISLLSGALILATILTVVVVLATRDGEQPPAAAPTVPAAGSAPSDATESPTPAESTIPTTPAPTPSRTIRTQPMDLIVEYAGRVQQQINADELDSDAGRRLLRRLNEAAEKLKDGDRDEAASKLAEVDHRLNELRQDDKLSAAGYRALNVLDPIIAAIRRT